MRTRTPSGNEGTASTAWLGVDRPAGRAVTPRAVLLGLLLVPLLCAWSLRHELIYGGTEFIEASLVLIAVFTLFVLVLLNTALGRWAPRWVFSRGELLT